MSRGIATPGTAGATQEGYELGDWEFFQTQVESLGSARWGKAGEAAVIKFLQEWHLDNYLHRDGTLDMSVEDIVEDMALIIARLEGES